MKLVGIIWTEKRDFKVSAPPTSRMHGFVTFSGVVLVPFSALVFLCARSLGLESRAVSGLSVRRDWLREAALRRPSRVQQFRAWVLDFRLLGLRGCLIV